MILVLLLLMWFQDGDVYQRITIDNGLSQNMVNDILLDDRGFLWFATKDGLNRYDGHSFTVFRNYPGQLESLTSNHITSLWQASDGWIWMTTNGGGINRLNPATGRSESVEGPKKPEMIFSSWLEGDSQQRIWALTQTDGLVSLDTKTREFTALHNLPGFSEVGNIGLYKITDNDRIWSISSQVVQFISPDESLLLKWTVTDPADRPTGLLVLNDSLLLFATRTGIHYMHRRGSTLIREPTVVQNQSFGFGSTFTRDDKGHIWMTSLTDMYRVDLEAGKLIWLFRHDTRPTAAMQLDHSGILWLGTAGWGVIHYNPERQYLRRSSDPFPEQIFSDAIASMKRRGYPVPDWSIGADHAYTMTVDGDIWMSAIGFKVYRYRPSDRSIRYIQSEHGWLRRHNLNRGFNRIHVGSDRRVWFAGSGGLFEWVQQIDSLVYHPIYAGAVPDQEYINRTGNPDITSISEDASGTLWMGTPDRGLVRYSPSSGSIVWYTHDSHRAGSLSSNQILSVLVDPAQPDRYVWVGTEGGGLNRLNIQTGQWDVFFTTHGLPSMVIYGILPDDDENLWMSTNNGLVRLDPKTLEFRRFSVSDGIHNREFNRFEYVRHPDGSLYFGGIGGHTQVIPSLYRVGRHDSRIQLTNFLLFNRPVDPSILERYHNDSESPLRLKFDEDMITFEFASLEYTALGSNRYRYRMDGFDRNWIDAGQTHTATFTNLAPGEYMFRVQAAIGDGSWSESELRVPLLIAPPYWMTWWFRSFIGLSGVMLVGIVVQLRVRKLRREKEHQEDVTLRVIEKQEEERRRIANEMHDGLGQELLVIKNMLYRWATRPETAEPAHVLKTASDHIGGILKSVREITHNLRPPELDRIGITETIRYTLEKATVAAGIQLHVDIPPFNGFIPAEHEISVVRIFQEMLSNTIKHASASEVTCSITMSETHLDLHYHDNGNGLPADVDPSWLRQGLGMSGIAERVRILGGTLTLDTKGFTGLSYHIRIPNPNLIRHA